MSIESVSKALNCEVEMTPTMKLVLIGVANHDGDGGAWPAVSTLAGYANTSNRTVQRCLRNLEELGLLTSDKNGGGNARTRGDKRPNLYHLHLDHGVTSCVTPSDHGVTPVTQRGDTGGTNGVTPMTERGDIAVSPEPSLNHPVTVLEPNTSQTSFDDALALDLCREIHAAMITYGHTTAKVNKGWVTDMDRLMRIDKRTPEQIRRVIRWLYGSTDSEALFWAVQVQSPKNLRKHWDRMALQYQAKRQATSNPYAEMLKGST